MAKQNLAEAWVYGQAMRISWGKGLSQQLKSMGMLADYVGIPDPELEMQYIENQLNMFIA